MMLFSQRIGKKPARKVIQIESIDDDLRNSLWNALIINYLDNILYLGISGRVERSSLEGLIKNIWIYYFKKPLDTIEVKMDHCLKKIKEYFFQIEWYEVLDFIEFIAHHGPELIKDKFIIDCNKYLENENSAYRFVHEKVTEITSEEEIRSIESAIENSTPYRGVRTHLTTALHLLSDKANPDFRNSIKESISSVESLAKQVSGDDNAKLKSVLKELEVNGKLHPALKSAFSSLYGYTSDAEGIRHALMNESNLTKADARFMIICCSAFINYFIDVTSTST